MINIFLLDKKQLILALFVVFSFAIFAPVFSVNGEFDMNKLNAEIGDSSITTTDSGVVVAGSTETTSVPILILRVIGSLVVMGLLIIGVVWGIKKSGVVNSGTPLRKSSFELMQSFATGTGTTIVMIRFENSVLLLGQTSSNINLLKTIEGDVARVLIEEHQGNDTVAGFQKSLNSFLTGMKQNSGEEKV